MFKSDKEEKHRRGGGHVNRDFVLGHWPHLSCQHRKRNDGKGLGKLEGLRWKKNVEKASAKQEGGEAYPSYSFSIICQPVSFSTNPQAQ